MLVEDVDTKAAIERAIDRMDLNTLFRGRHILSQEGARLKAWIVCSRWFLAERGGGELSAPLELGYPIGRVVAYESFTEVMGDSHWLGYSLAPMIAPAEADLCSVCGRGWSPATIADFEFSREPASLKHRRCAQWVRRKDERTEFESVFNEAGILPLLNEVPNGYYRAPTAPPWFVCATPFGDITIGWRKRVIEIVWEGPDLSALFEMENVTKGANLVHAWNRGKAIEYLGKIYRGLRKGEQRSAFP